MATPLAKKLLIKPGNIVLLINPPEGYRGLLGGLPDDVTVVGSGGGPGQVVQLFVHTRSELHAEAEAALEALTPGGVLWICYPKVASGLGDLSREALWDALAGHQWRPVTQVAVDDMWSAMRFRPVADVKSGK